MLATNISLTEARRIRGIAIISKGDSPQQVNPDCYLVPSQSSSKKYKVKNAGYKWLCECPDNQQRRIDCKHIHAIKFWLNVKDKAESRAVVEMPILQERESCVYCKSESIVRNGKRRCEGRLKQRFFCRSCGRTFVQDKDFEKIKGNPQVVTLAMDLYFKGVSLRKIKDHIKQFYNMEVHHETIRRWINRFMEALNNYTNTLQPQLSEVWHTDEQVIKSKGKNIYVWNILDSKTRFLIANNVTAGRTVEDARAVFSKSKPVGRPSFIITDGLQSYNDAIKKEYPAWWRVQGRVEHIRLHSFKTKPNNNLIERFHGSWRERDKVMRGFKGGEDKFAENYRTYYNFIRKHEALGMTPSEKAGIGLPMESNRWLSLLNLSTEMRQTTNKS